MTPSKARKRPASAALTNGKDRAIIVHKQPVSNIASNAVEANFAAICIARRYRLSPSLARAVAALSGLGVFG